MFKNNDWFLGGDPGPQGAMGIPYGRLETAIDRACKYGPRDSILLGYSPTPPDVDWCQVYIYFNGGGAEFFSRDMNGKWVNRSYQVY